MPYMSNGKRDYKKEEKFYEKKHPNRDGDRVARNQARKEAGLKVGDSRHADHIKPLTEGGSKKKSNIRIISAKSNLTKEANRKKRVAGK